jgi:hypothetical protein
MALKFYSRTLYGGPQVVVGAQFAQIYVEDSLWVILKEAVGVREPEIPRYLPAVIRGLSFELRYLHGLPPPTRFLYFAWAMDPFLQRPSRVLKEVIRTDTGYALCDVQLPQLFPEMPSEPKA